ncbi:sulfite exporter TauE/SafE family protein [Nocardioides sp. CER19]|uniref:sulfite exporter TauE/SafE family protein n=1 Tax=Nocardioides sp. CER19 TaxID=3038538 RepID=UPI00244B3E1B|nr:sulfite exporter TauE/SafE family protein [Nocardioides sp. CER19]MDH2415744.1 sulfite exporter TauE/SafE family protein [Nocardioides sp. CER19]
MGPLEALAILIAGLGAGTINAVVGSGTLLTFPTLLAFGFPPVTANVSNTIGLVPGSVAGAWGYRRELAGQRRRALRLGLASLLGGAAGGVLLLVLPEHAFETIVPVLIALGVLLVIFGPRISAWVAKRHGDGGGEHWWVWPAVLATGVYGGYFGAAQGVLLMAALGIGVADTLQRLNATKNVLAAIVNGVAGLIFTLVADVDWRVVALIAIGSVMGGLLGAFVGRRLPPQVLRGVIVVVGVVALVALLAK